MEFSQEQTELKLSESSSAQLMAVMGWEETAWHVFEGKCPRLEPGARLDGENSQLKSFFSCSCWISWSFQGLI